MALTRPRYSQIYDTDYKQSVRLATTTDVGNLLAGGGNITNSVDGVTVATNDRILVKDQNDAKQNGIYRVLTAGTGSNGTWIRALDADASDKVTSGLTTTVSEGTLNVSKTFKLSTPDPITLGTTELIFVDPFNITASAGGANTYVQFNDVNQLGGVSGFTFNKSANAVVISNGSLILTGNGGTDGSLTAQYQVTSTANINTLPTAGINFSNPYTNAGDLAGMGGISVSKLNNTNGDYSSYLSLHTRNNGGSTTERVRIGNTGNVSILTTIQSTSNSTGALIVAGGVGVSGNVYATTFYGNLAGSNIYISGSLIPSANVEYDLGSPTQRFRSGYFSGNTIYIGDESMSVDSNGKWSFTSSGSTVDLGTNSDFNPPTINTSGNVTVGEDLIVNGRLFVSGNSTVISANNLSLSDSLIYLAEGNPTDFLDIGFIGNFTRDGLYRHTGFARDASDGVWKLFDGVEPEPTTVVDFGSASYSTALIGNLVTRSNVTVGGNIRLGRALLSSAGLGGDPGQYLTSTGTGIAWTTLEVSASSISDGDTNVTATAEYVNVAVNSSTVASFSSTGISATGLTVSGSTAVDLNSASTDFALGLKVGRYITGQSGSKLSITNQSNGIFLEGGSNAVIDLAGTTAQIGQNAGTGSFTVQMATTTLQGTQDSTGTGTGALRVSGGAGIVGSIYVNSANNPIAIGNGGTNGVGNIGATATRFNTVFAKATSAQYADLAEVYTSDRNYIPGTVVVFGGDREVTVSLTSHDPSVAGVISTNPAYIMNSDCDGVFVALQGRVPCRVLGPVTKGDRVVSSDIRGVAERLDMTKYQPGCIIGKTLDSVSDGEIATIEVVVGRN